MVLLEGMLPDEQAWRRKTTEHHGGLMIFYLSLFPKIHSLPPPAQGWFPWAMSLAQSRSLLASCFRLALPRGLPGLR